MSDDSAVGSQTATALYNAIQDQTLHAVLPKLSSVIQIDASEKPVDASNLLWKHHLLAVPVYNEVEHKYVGFFDVRDILRAILKAQQEKPQQSDATSDEGNETPASIEEDTEDEEELILQTLQDVSLLHDDNNDKVTLTSLAARRPAYCCRPDDSLEEVCRLLAQSNCRRVLICPQDNGGRCTDMVSRSTMIQYLASHVSPTDLQETLNQAGLDYRKDVMSISQDATAQQAFDLILEKKLYSLAVVDDEGGLVGNTSARDISLVALHPTTGINAFELDILSFLASVRQEDSVTNGKKAKYPATHVRESCSVGHVLQLLAKTRYHRVFVTNDYLEPVGVISELDILQFLLSKGKLQLSHDLPILAE